MELTAIAMLVIFSIAILISLREHPGQRKVFCSLILAILTALLIHVSVLLILGYLYPVALIPIIAVLFLVGRRAYRKEHESTPFTIVVIGAMIVLTILFVLFFLMIYLPHGDMNTRIVSTGWMKIRPLSPSVSFTNDTFTAHYVNGVGTSIRLCGTDVNARELISDTPCDFGLSNETCTTVRAGDNFQVNGTCQATKVEGEPYDLRITIIYNHTISGANARRNESGHIKGQAD